MKSIKAKDRLPSETITILTQFFNDRNFKLLINKSTSEIGSYSCEIWLKFNDIVVMHSNGKGTTEEYSLASGLAELYERFCNLEGVGYSTDFFNRIINNNYKNYGYYLNPSEKINISYQEAMKYPVVSKTINSISGNNEKYNEWIFNKYTDNNYIGVPYYNINNNKDILYLDKRINFVYLGSNGMTAGNSFEEAFCSGISELYERSAILNFYNNTNEPIYALNINNITLSEEIRNIINNLPYDFYILELSNYANGPVIGLIILDKERIFSRMDLGCFPNINIAIERTLTELYQNVFSFNECYDIQFIPPFAKEGEDLLNDEPHTIINNSYLPKNFFNRLVYIDDYNHDYYIEETDSQSIYNFYINLIKKNNLNIYYNDCSLSKDMVALHLYSPELSITWINRNTMYISDNIKEDTDYLSTVTQELKNKMDMQDIYNNNFKQLMRQSLLDINSLRYHYTQDFSGGDILVPLSLGDDITLNWLELISRILETPGAINYKVDCDYKLKLFIGYPILKKYLVIMQYYINNKSLKELNDDLQPYGIRVTKEDYENCLNLEYLMFKTFYEPLSKFYNSADYQNIINGFIKKEPK